TAHRYQSRRREMGLMAVTHNVMIVSPDKRFYNAYLSRFPVAGSSLTWWLAVCPAGSVRLTSLRSHSSGFCSAKGPNSVWEDTSPRIPRGGVLDIAHRRSQFCGATIDS